MNADVIQLFSLVGLRALAEYDAAEYRRVTDLSRNELDEKIRQLQLLAANEPLLAEVLARMSEFDLIQGESRSQTELSFLLKQLSNSCLQRAQQLALLQGRIARSEDPGIQQARAVVRDTEPPTTTSPGGEEFVKLAAMRLLRTLPAYAAEFNVRLKNVEVDCLLRPADSRLPVVFIEAKVALRNEDVLKSAVSQLKKASSGWGKGALQVVLTTTVDQSLRRSTIGGRAGEPYLLVYDQESNDFVNDTSEKQLVDAVRRVQDALP
ncbi:hypothetical protein [Piscinibacter sakaiensis]|uniref:hypothetical protein n=1 Tax=Piscinibacter sakaiensis TaxID=1547922 RepID=UPI003AABBE2D